MFTKELFGQRLREMRKAAKENQEDLAALLGVTKTQISDLENGKVSTTLEKLALICEHYKVSADYLLGLDEEAR
jgi:transcriptional regulator with XRE-family HTH domain